jgi:hypothetical protein
LHQRSARSKVEAGQFADLCLAGGQEQVERQRAGRPDEASLRPIPDGFVASCI